MYKYRIVKITDKEYPFLLKQINDPPAVLYVRGQLPDFNVSVSIVGSRKHTDYGRKVTKDLAEAAARTGAVVVSGLAYGIDSIAHQATLEAGGVTVAVLPCDISQVSPPAHERLAQEIVNGGGAVISEVPIGTKLFPSHFLVRNRIIAGLTPLTIVTEAACKSGALATARCAADYQRSVMAAPGSIFSPCSAGTNNLIVRGSGIILSTNDMLKELGIVSAAVKIRQLDRLTQLLLTAIPERGIALERLVELLQLDFVEISSKVILLEMNGLVTQVGEGIYRRLL